MLSRQVQTGHEQPFEAVRRRLAAVARYQPGHLYATVPKPCPGGPPSCTIVSYPARRQDADAWPSSKVQARLAVQAEVHSQDARRRSTCPDWRAGWPRPGTPALVPAALAAAGARVVVNHDHTPEPAEKVAVGIETAGGPRSRSPPTSAAGPNARRWSSSCSPPTAAGTPW